MYGSSRSHIKWGLIAWPRTPGPLGAASVGQEHSNTSVLFWICTAADTLLGLLHHVEEQRCSLAVRSLLMLRNAAYRSCLMISRCLNRTPPMPRRTQRVQQHFSGEEKGRAPSAGYSPAH
ncbi:hypothetical protein NDU88_002780 [Pleurodeles waltl]|uniref:Uncharacterized protein n=1 Tax=Pleurodeles waltl TaxID=8319 RepID=A0AAV7SCN1_PLEWA|nr:hypothetical protein NDU88_002780 [Pleurodeles waltl]